MDFLDFVDLVDLMDFGSCVWILWSLVFCLSTLSSPLLCDSPCSNSKYNIGDQRRCHAKDTSLGVTNLDHQSPQWRFPKCRIHFHAVCAPFWVQKCDLVHWCMRACVCKFIFREEIKPDFCLRSEKDVSCALDDSRCFKHVTCLPCDDFDATKGYPGEGPPPKTCTLLSYFVGSLKTNAVWKTAEETILRLQEARIGRNNTRTSANMVQTTGRKLFAGEKLPGILSDKGFSRTPHGGTAILAPDETSKPFTCEEDSTGLYAQVFATKRANAVWIQVLPKVRLLLFCFYGQSGAAFDYNTEILDKIFLISAQSGDIPVAIAGDFQTLPQHYKPVYRSITFCGWRDPLLTTDENGDWHRPVTFSRDGSFAGGDFALPLVQSY